MQMQIQSSGPVPVSVAVVLFCFEDGHYYFVFFLKALPSARAETWVGGFIIPGSEQQKSKPVVGWKASMSDASGHNF